MALLGLWLLVALVAVGLWNTAHDVAGWFLRRRDW